MRPLSTLLTRHGLSRADGRALHAYAARPAELQELGRLLSLHLGRGERLAATAQAFVLWAAERIRADWPGGHLTWEFVFDGLGRAPPDYAFTRWLVETGLREWGRPLRRGLAGHREFLFSLLAEGGLPDAALAQANRYRAVLLALIGELEAEGALAAAAAEAKALRAVQDLPQVLRDEGQARLMAELALALIALRRALPDHLPAEAAVGWLDANRPGWRASLPLRLSDQALTTIVRPALAALRAPIGQAAAPVRRELVRDDAGHWRGAADIVEGACLPGPLLPSEAGTTVLRLVSAGGASFLARPEGSGWRLARVGGSARMALDPSAPVVLSAYADGRLVGEIVLDPGLPAPDEAPGLWHPANPDDSEPERLVPLTGRGRTRAAGLWLLLPDTVTPVAGEGLRLGAPAPGPGGRLWPVRGRGQLRIDDQTLVVETASDTAAEPARLMASGPLLPGLAMSDGTRAHLGEPQLWAAQGDGPLMPLKGSERRLRPLPRWLGGWLAERIDGSVVLARLRLIVLPARFRLELRETAPGRLRLAVSGAEPGWHLALGTAGAAPAQAIADAGGRAELELQATGAPGLVSLRLSDPAKGAALTLTGLWPASEPRLIDPDGQVLRQDRRVALARLAGWRGHLPAGRGALLVRLGGQGAQVGFAAQGEVRPAAYAAILGQALALAGADGQVNLRLALVSETPRLEVARYDWAADEAGPVRHSGPGRLRLSAVDLDDPARTSTTEAEDRIDLAAWLGDGEGLWFVQGVHDRRGIMRPFVWAAQPRPPSTRAARLELFAADWEQLLREPADPGWDRRMALIAAVRAAGDCGALDQVQALAQVPAAAVALVLMAPRDGRAAALALETETRIWWPLVPVAAWARGVQAAYDRLRARIAAAGVAEAAKLAAEAMARAAGEIVALRPELATHLGAGLALADLPPVALRADGREEPLAVSRPTERLANARQEAGRRFDGLPQGVGGLRAAILPSTSLGDGGMDDLLQAPLVAAEVAAGLRDPLAPPDILRLIALRAADPAYFSAALPCALTLALDRSPR